MNLPGAPTERKTGLERAIRALRVRDGGLDFAQSGVTPPGGDRLTRPDPYRVLSNRQRVAPGGSAVETPNAVLGLTT
jgi:hypothetical protein